MNKINFKDSKDNLFLIISIVMLILLVVLVLFATNYYLAIVALRKINSTGDDYVKSKKQSLI